MRIFRASHRSVVGAGLAAITITSLGCQGSMFQSKEPAVISIRDTPAVRLNYRYEADVPPPTLTVSKAGDERDRAIQADFDASRPMEILDRTVASPDKKRVLVVYHRISDQSSEFRLDMYSSDGKLLRKLTSDTMAVHFPDTIVWSPDSTSVAFVAMLRTAQPDVGLAMTPGPAAASPLSSPAVSDESNAAAESTSTPLAAVTPGAPTGILAFRTEQIYISTADGGGVKAITQNEGLIYFYYAWSPDSSMLVALAATAREWRYLEVIAGGKGELMVPQGRLRIIEKNGRERRLDDNLTSVRPVWSPDSSKVAEAFETQVRIYDAAGVNPTQAAIPLRNDLLISSQAYDRNQQRMLSNSNLDPNAQASAPQPNDEPISTLPDEKMLVSYNPIVEIAWTADDLLYLQTAYLRRMRNEADSVRSFSRWHRVALSVQQSPSPKNR